MWVLSKYNTRHQPFVVLVVVGTLSPHDDNIFGVAGATLHPSTMLFPDSITRFPRTDWKHVPFSCPPIPRGMLDAKARWAACTASKRWQAAFDDDNDGHLTTGTPGQLDAVDFAVAVFGVAYRMKDYMRVISRHRKSTIASGEGWRAITDLVIQTAYDIVGLSCVLNAVRRLAHSFTRPARRYRIVSKTLRCPNSTMCASLRGAPWTVSGTKASTRWVRCNALNTTRTCLPTGMC